MEQYGVTPAGFKVKPFDVIIQEIQDLIKVKCGNDIVFIPEDPLKEIIDSVSSEMYSLWLQQLDIYNSGYISKASGKSLDYACEMVNVTRDAPIKGIISQQAFWGIAGASLETDTVVSSTANSAFGWQPTEEHILGAGQNANYSFDRSEQPTAGSFKLVILGQQTEAIPYNATPTDVENAISNLFGVFEVVVDYGITTWLDFTFTLQDIGKITVSDNTLVAGGVAVDLFPIEVVSGEYQLLASVTALDAGVQAANIFAVTTIVEQTGSAITDTLNIVEAAPGASIERDEELRDKSINGYQLVKYTTLPGISSGLKDIDYIETVRLVSNDKSIPLFPGTPNEIPPNSFKPYIFPRQTLTTAQEEEIANTLMTKKPVGIQSVGDVEYTVIDSEGYPQVVGFNYPIGVLIYLEMVLTTNASFPTNGEILLQNNMVEWGNQLGAGVDIIIHGSDSVCGVVNDIPGITSYTLKIGKITPPTDANNIPIDDGYTSGTVEVSEWVAANMLITKA